MKFQTFWRKKRTKKGKQRVFKDQFWQSVAATLEDVSVAETLFNAKLLLFRLMSFSVHSITSCTCNQIKRCTKTWWDLKTRKWQKKKLLSICTKSLGLIFIMIHYLLSIDHSSKCILKVYIITQRQTIYDKLIFLAKEMK